MALYRAWTGCIASRTIAGFSIRACMIVSLETVAVSVLRRGCRASCARGLGCLFTSSDLGARAVDPPGVQQAGGRSGVFPGPGQGGQGKRHEHDPERGSGDEHRPEQPAAIGGML